MMSWSLVIGVTLYYALELDVAHSYTRALSSDPLSLFLVLCDATAFLVGGAILHLSMVARRQVRVTRATTATGVILIAYGVAAGATTVWLAWLNTRAMSSTLATACVGATIVAGWIFGVQAAQQWLLRSFEAHYHDERRLDARR